MTKGIAKSASSRKLLTKLREKYKFHVRHKANRLPDDKQKYENTH